jgi:hypothetical protein
MVVSAKCIALFAVFVVIALAGCDGEPTSRLKGQRNATITFYGRAVDENGLPLPGAQFAYQVDAYPKDWTFETRGRPYDTSVITAISDEQGRFQFTVTGCGIRRLKAELDNRRHFFDEDATTTASTYGYQLIAWRDLWFRSHPDHPAIYVFVTNDVKEVAALPCKGGYDSGGGTQWRLNEPAWPKKPSLKDVVQKQPTSQPGTRPS